MCVKSKCQKDMHVGWKDGIEVCHNILVMWNRVYF